VLLPIEQEYNMGKGKAVAICTLSSRTYCTILSNSELMADLLIADTLLSENKGIDAMINFTLKHPELSRIIICGKEVKVHRVGQVLLALKKMA
jgi:tetrahydromethanopterin S-methyltransferase subunit A